MPLLTLGQAQALACSRRRGDAERACRGDLVASVKVAGTPHQTAAHDEAHCRDDTGTACAGTTAPEKRCLPGISPGIPAQPLCQRRRVSRALEGTKKSKSARTLPQ